MKRKNFKKKQTCTFFLFPFKFFFFFIGFISRIEEIYTKKSKIKQTHDEFTYFQNFLSDLKMSNFPIYQNLLQSLDKEHENALKNILEIKKIFIPNAEEQSCSIRKILKIKKK